jgi:hypothetical protein
VENESPLCLLYAGEALPQTQAFSEGDKDVPTMGVSF